MNPSPNAMNITPAQKSLPFVIFISPSTSPAKYCATGFAAGTTPSSSLFAIHVGKQLGTGLAQPLRQHKHQFHEDFRPERRLLQDDARQTVARQHRDHARLGRNAARKARLAVDHRHFAERLPRRDNGDEPRRIPPVLLEHFDSALDEKTHEIARLAFADDFYARLRAVGLHEPAQRANFRQVEVLEKRRERDETVNPVGELCGAAQRLQLRQPGPFRRFCHLRTRLGEPSHAGRRPAPRAGDARDYAQTSYRSQILQDPDAGRPHPARNHPVAPSHPTVAAIRWGSCNSSHAGSPPPPFEYTTRRYRNRPYSTNGRVKISRSVP